MSHTRLKNPLNNLTSTANELVSYIETMDKKELSEKMAAANQAGSTLSWLLSWAYTAAPQENEKSNIDTVSKFLQTNEANEKITAYFLQSLLGQMPGYDAAIKLESGSLNTLKELLQINIQNRNTINAISIEAVVDIDPLSKSTLLSQSTLVKITETAKAAANTAAIEYLTVKKKREERQKSAKQENKNVDTKALIKQFENNKPAVKEKLVTQQPAEEKKEINKISQNVIKDMQGKLGHIYGSRPSPQPGVKQEIDQKVQTRIFTP